MDIVIFIAARVKKKDLSVDGQFFELGASLATVKFVIRREGVGLKCGLCF